MTFLDLFMMKTDRTPLEEGPKYPPIEYKRKDDPNWCAACKTVHEPGAFDLHKNGKRKRVCREILERMAKKRKIDQQGHAWVFSDGNGCHVEGKHARA